MLKAREWGMVITTAVLVGAAAPALAWDDYGHQLAAAIAYADLRPEVKAKVTAILKAHPQYELLAMKCPKGLGVDEYVFLRACTWPDMVRIATNPLHDTDHHPTWHYINIPVNQGGTTGTTPDFAWTPGSDPQNAVQALAKAEAGLKNTKLSDADHAKALCWLLHIGSDLHQPLHSVALFSPQFPTGDKGGNSFFVGVDGRPTNLHSFWDKSLSGRAGDSNAVVARAKKLTDKPEFSREKLKKQLAVTGYADWAKESVALAESSVYLDGKLKGAKAGKDAEQAGEPVPPLPEGYKARAEQVAERQIVVGGYRLGDSLNRSIEYRDR